MRSELGLDTVTTKKNCVTDVSDIEFVVSKYEKLSLKKHNFLRVSAVRQTFDGVDFRYCTFDDCYFRNCKFIDCDFTGAQFKNSSFRGSEFNASKFDYARFSNTRITNSILDNCQPGFENIALEFSQSLRVNFGQIGDTVGVNKSIKNELDATKVHLKKAAFSKEAWYRDKYSGLNRLKSVWDYIVFCIFDWIWGNGESLLNVVLSMLAVIFFAALALDAPFGEFCESLINSLQVFLGQKVPDIPTTVSLTLIFSRYVLLGLFVSVLVKRLSRR